MSSSSPIPSDRSPTINRTSLPVLAGLTASGLPLIQNLSYSRASANISAESRDEGVAGKERGLILYGGLTASGLPLVQNLVYSRVSQPISTREEAIPIREESKLEREASEKELDVVEDSQPEIVAVVEDPKTPESEPKVSPIDELPSETSNFVSNGLSVLFGGLTSSGVPLIQNLVYSRDSEPTRKRLDSSSEISIEQEVIEGDLITESIDSEIEGNLLVEEGSIAPDSSLQQEVERSESKVEEKEDVSIELEPVKLDFPKLEDLRQITKEPERLPEETVQVLRESVDRETRFLVEEAVKEASYVQTREEYEKPLLEEPEFCEKELTPVPEAASTEEFVRKEEQVEEKPVETFVASQESTPSEKFEHNEAPVEELLTEPSILTLELEKFKKLKEAEKRESAQPEPVLSPVESRDKRLERLVQLENELRVGLASIETDTQAPTNGYERQQVFEQSSKPIPFVELPTKFAQSLVTPRRYSDSNEAFLANFLRKVSLLKMTDEEKYDDVIERLRKLEDELKISSIGLPPDPEFTHFVGKVLKGSYPNADLQIIVNSSRKTTTTKSFYETETPGMVGLNGDQIRDLQKKLMENISSPENAANQPDTTVPSDSLQRKEVTEEGYAEPDGSEVVSKKMTRVVTTSQSTVSGLDDHPEATRDEIETQSITSLGSVKDRIAIFESINEKLKHDKEAAPSIVHKTVTEEIVYKGPVTETRIVETTTYEEDTRHVVEEHKVKEPPVAPERVSIREIRQVFERHEEPSAAHVPREVPPAVPYEKEPFETEVLTESRRAESHYEPEIERHETREAESLKEVLETIIPEIHYTQPAEEELAIEAEPIEEEHIEERFEPETIEAELQPEPEPIHEIVETTIQETRYERAEAESPPAEPEPIEERFVHEEEPTLVEPSEEHVEITIRDFTEPIEKHLEFETPEEEKFAPESTDEVIETTIHEVQHIAAPEEHAVEPEPIQERHFEEKFEPEIAELEEQPEIEPSHEIFETTTHEIHYTETPTEEHVAEPIPVEERYSEERSEHEMAPVEERPHLAPEPIEERHIEEIEPTEPITRFEEAEKQEFEERYEAEPIHYEEEIDREADAVRKSPVREVEEILLLEKESIEEARPTEAEIEHVQQETPVISHEETSSERWRTHEVAEEEPERPTSEIEVTSETPAHEMLEAEERPSRETEFEHEPEKVSEYELVEEKTHETPEEVYPMEPESITEAPVPELPTSTEEPEQHATVFVAEERTYMRSMPSEVEEEPHAHVETREEVHHSPEEPIPEAPIPEVPTSTEEPEQHATVLITEERTYIRSMPSEVEKEPHEHMETREEVHQIHEEHIPEAPVPEVPTSTEEPEQHATVVVTEERIYTRQMPSKVEEEPHELHFEAAVPKLEEERLTEGVEEIYRKPEVVSEEVVHAYEQEFYEEPVQKPEVPKGHEDFYKHREEPLEQEHEAYSTEYEQEYHEEPKEEGISAAKMVAGAVVLGAMAIGEKVKEAVSGLGRHEEEQGAPLEFEEQHAAYEPETHERPPSEKEISPESPTSEHITQESYEERAPSEQEPSVVSSTREEEPHRTIYIEETTIIQSETVPKEFEEKSFEEPIEKEFDLSHDEEHIASPIKESLVEEQEPQEYPSEGLEEAPTVPIQELEPEKEVHIVERHVVIDGATGEVITEEIMKRDEFFVEREVEPEKPAFEPEGERHVEPVEGELIETTFQETPTEDQPSELPKESPTEEQPFEPKELPLEEVPEEITTTGSPIKEHITAAIAESLVERHPEDFLKEYPREEVLEQTEYLYEVVEEAPHELAKAPSIENLSREAEPEELEEAENEEIPAEPVHYVQESPDEEIHRLQEELIRESAVLETPLEEEHIESHLEVHVEKEASEVPSEEPPQEPTAEVPSSEKEAYVVTESQLIESQEIPTEPLQADPEKVFVKNIDRPFVLRKVANVSIFTGYGELTAELIDPEGYAVKVVLMRTSPDEYNLSFMPIKIGHYELNLRLSGMDVPDTPKRLFVEEPGKPSLYGSALEHEVELGQPVSLIFDPKETKGGIKIDVRNHDSEKVRHTTDRRSDGTTEILFMPTQMGIHRVSVDFNNKPIQGSPYEVRVVPSEEQIISEEAFIVEPTKTHLEEAAFEEPSAEAETHFKEQHEVYSAGYEQTGYESTAYEQEHPQESGISLPKMVAGAAILGAMAIGEKVKEAVSGLGRHDEGIVPAMYEERTPETPYYEERISHEERAYPPAHEIVERPYDEEQHEIYGEHAPVAAYEEERAGYEERVPEVIQDEAEILHEEERHEIPEEHIPEAIHEEEQVVHEPSRHDEEAIPTLYEERTPESDYHEEQVSYGERIQLDAEIPYEEDKAGIQVEPSDEMAEPEKVELLIEEHVVEEQPPQEEWQKEYEEAEQQALAELPSPNRNEEMLKMEEQIEHEFETHEDRYQMVESDSIPTALHDEARFEKEAGAEEATPVEETPVKLKAEQEFEEHVRDEREEHEEIPVESPIEKAESPIHTEAEPVEEVLIEEKPIEPERLQAYDEYQQGIESEKPETIVQDELEMTLKHETPFEPEHKDEQPLEKEPEIVEEMIESAETQSTEEPYRQEVEVAPAYHEEPTATEIGRQLTQAVEIPVELVEEKVVVVSTEIVEEPYQHEPEPTPISPVSPEHGPEEVSHDVCEEDFERKAAPTEQVAVQQVEQEVSYEPTESERYAYEEEQYPEPAHEPVYGREQETVEDTEEDRGYSIPKMIAGAAILGAMKIGEKVKDAFKGGEGLEYEAEHEETVEETPGEFEERREIEKTPVEVEYELPKEPETPEFEKPEDVEAVSKFEEQIPSTPTSPVVELEKPEEVPQVEAELKSEEGIPSPSPSPVEEGVQEQPEIVESDSIYIEQPSTELQEQKPFEVDHELVETEEVPIPEPEECTFEPENVPILTDSYVAEEIRPVEETSETAKFNREFIESEESLIQETKGSPFEPEGQYVITDSYVEEQRPFEEAEQFPSEPEQISKTLVEEVLISATKGIEPTSEVVHVPEETEHVLVESEEVPVEKDQFAEPKFDEEHQAPSEKPSFEAVTEEVSTPIKEATFAYDESPKEPQVQEDWQKEYDEHGIEKIQTDAIRHPSPPSEPMPEPEKEINASEYSVVESESVPAEDIESKFDEELKTALSDKHELEREKREDAAEYAPEEPIQERQVQEYRFQEPVEYEPETYPAGYEQQYPEEPKEKGMSAAKMVAGAVVFGAMAIGEKVKSAISGKRDSHGYEAVPTEEYDYEEEGQHFEDKSEQEREPLVEYGEMPSREMERSHEMYFEQPDLVESEEVPQVQTEVKFEPETPKPVGITEKVTEEGELVETEEILEEKRSPVETPSEQKPLDHIGLEESIYEVRSESPIAEEHGVVDTELVESETIESLLPAAEELPESTVITPSKTKVLDTAGLEESIYEKELESPAGEERAEERLESELIESETVEDVHHAAEPYLKDEFEISPPVHVEEKESPTEEYHLVESESIEPVAEQKVESPIHKEPFEHFPEQEDEHLIEERRSEVEITVSEDGTTEKHYEEEIVICESPVLRHEEGQESEESIEKEPSVPASPEFIEKELPSTEHEELVESESIPIDLHHEAQFEPEPIKGTPTEKVYHEQKEFPSQEEWQREYEEPEQDSGMSAAKMVAGAVVLGAMAIREKVKEAVSGLGKTTEHETEEFVEEYQPSQEPGFPSEPIHRLHEEVPIEEHKVEMPEAETREAEAEIKPRYYEETPEIITSAMEEESSVIQSPSEEIVESEELPERIQSEESSKFEPETPHPLTPLPVDERKEEITVDRSPETQKVLEKAAEELLIESQKVEKGHEYPEEDHRPSPTEAYSVTEEVSKTPELKEDEEYYVESEEVPHEAQFEEAKFETEVPSLVKPKDVEEVLEIVEKEVDEEVPYDEKSPIEEYTHSEPSEETYLKPEDEELVESAELEPRKSPEEPIYEESATAAKERLEMEEYEVVESEEIPSGELHEETKFDEEPKKTPESEVEVSRTTSEEQESVTSRQESIVTVIEKEPAEGEEISPRSLESEEVPQVPTEHEEHAAEFESTIYEEHKLETPEVEYKIVESSEVCEEPVHAPKSPGLETEEAEGYQIVESEELSETHPSELESPHKVDEHLREEEIKEEREAPSAPELESPEEISEPSPVEERTSPDHKVLEEYHVIESEEVPQEQEYPKLSVAGEHIAGEQEHPEEPRPPSYEEVTRQESLHQEPPKYEYEEQQAPEEPDSGMSAAKMVAGAVVLGAMAIGEKLKEAVSGIGQHDEGASYQEIDERLSARSVPYVIEGLEGETPRDEPTLTREVPGEAEEVPQHHEKPEEEVEHPERPIEGLKLESDTILQEDIKSPSSEHPSEKTIVLRETSEASFEEFNVEAPEDLLEIHGKETPEQIPEEEFERGPEKEEELPTPQAEQGDITKGTEMLHVERESPFQELNAPTPEDLLEIHEEEREVPVEEKEVIEEEGYDVVEREELPAEPEAKHEIEERQEEPKESLREPTPEEFHVSTPEDLLRMHEEEQETRRREPEIAEGIEALTTDTESRRHEVGEEEVAASPEQRVPSGMSYEELEEAMRKSPIERELSDIQLKSEEIVDQALQNVLSEEEPSREPSTSPFEIVEPETEAIPQGDLIPAYDRLESIDVEIQQATGAQLVPSGLAVADLPSRPKSPVPPRFLQEQESPEPKVQAEQEPHAEELREAEKFETDSLNEDSGSSGEPSVAETAVTTSKKQKHVSTDNLSESSLQEFERLELELQDRHEGSPSSLEAELEKNGAGSIAGSINSLTEFENLEREVQETVAEDAMMLSDIREEEEVEEMSIREDDEDENADSLAEPQPRTVDPMQQSYYGGEPMITSVDSLELAHVQEKYGMDTSMDSLENRPRNLMETSIDSTSNQNYITDKDSLLECVTSQENPSQDTQVLTGDTVGTYQEYQNEEEDDRDSLNEVINDYPTTLTTFETVQVLDDGSAAQIIRRVQTRVTDPVHSHVRFTGTEDEEHVKSLPFDETVETVDEEGNITVTTLKRALS